MSEESTTQRVSPKNNLGIPVAIVIAAGLIAGAIYFSGTKNQPAVTGGPLNPNQQVTPEVQTVPIQATDHVQGNPEAPIVLVEYSDFDCPFCKRFHEETMIPIINEYGPSGKVAWVYRHLPLESLHPNAPRIAEASECVAKEAGNAGFWKFADLVFGERTINAPTDLTRLPEFAETAGANKATFESCFQSGEFKEKVSNSINEAIAANGGPSGLGTPFTLVFVDGRYIAPIMGAQSITDVKNNIESILAQLES